jgi:hypothetical protein
MKNYSEIAIYLLFSGFFDVDMGDLLLVALLVALKWTCV